jgi:hypothetical protein
MMKERKKYFIEMRCNFIINDAEEFEDNSKQTNNSNSYFEL